MLQPIGLFWEFFCLHFGINRIVSFFRLHRFMPFIYRDSIEAESTHLDQIKFKNAMKLSICLRVLQLSMSLIIMLKIFRQQHSVEVSEWIGDDDKETAWQNVWTNGSNSGTFPAGTELAEWMEKVFRIVMNPHETWIDAPSSKILITFLITSLYNLRFITVERLEKKRKLKLANKVLPFDESM